MITKKLVLPLTVFVACVAITAFGRSDYSEYSPTISADGNTMIFQADIDKKGSFKIYIKKKTGNKWGSPVLIDEVNSRFSDGGCFITYDQNYLLLTSNRADGKGDADIWISQRAGDKWSKPVNLGEPVNTPGYEGFATLSPDGHTLYFVRECPEKKGTPGEKYGIFYSERTEAGGWSVPKKMPAPVNSDYSEFGPVILADSITLIFSSTRPGGFGSYDIYKTEKTERGGWSEPVNLGSFINTADEDSLVTIPASGDVMYYTRTASPGKEGKGGPRRIHSVPIPDKLQQTGVVIVRGFVRDRRNPGKTLHAQIAITDTRKGGKPIIIESNKKDGSYIVILSRGRACDFAASRKGYMFHSQRIDLTDIKTYREVTQDILLEPIVAGASIVLNTLYFPFRSHTLSPESKYELKRLIALMRENPGMKVEISGHTDNVGTPKMNNELSLRRAESVAGYLVKSGVEKRRLVAKGYGSSRPVEDNKTEDGRGKNRRVEIEVLSVY